MSRTPTRITNISLNPSAREISAGINYLINRPFGYTDGGSVTQATSKSTAVTLNKLCGQIITHNAALASGVEVAFQLLNSNITSTDLLVANIESATGGRGVGEYSVRVGNAVSGSCFLVLRNMSGGSLSDAVTINFAIIKAANS